jgi:cytochrome c-type biogenesis protein CcmH/NrfG
MTKPTSLTSQDERVLYEAGYLLLTRGKIKASREVFEGLIAMTPQKSLPYTYLGNTYFAELKFDDAIKAHRKALELDGSNLLSMAHLGEALLVSKKKEEGLSTLKKVVSLDPNGPYGNMAKALLHAVEAGAI